MTANRLKTIPASGGVKKIGPGEGRTIQIGNVRLIWKATGADTGYGTSLYEMDLPPALASRCTVIRTPRFSM